MLKKHPFAVSAAVLAHLAFIAVLFYKFDFDSAVNGGSAEKKDFITVKTIDEKELKARENKKKAAAKKIKDAKLKVQKAKAEKKKREKIKKQKAVEKKRLAELEKKRKADKKKKAKIKKKEEIRKQKEVKRKQEEHRKKEEAQAEIELKDKMDADRAARAQAASLAESKKQKYINRIKGTIVRHWRVPAGTNDSLVSIVEVRTIPSGDVLDVQIIKKSGDAVFDKSVVNAVFRSSPIPVPGAETGLYNEFRVFNLKFEPRNQR